MNQLVVSLLVCCAWAWWMAAAGAGVRVRHAFYRDLQSTGPRGQLVPDTRRVFGGAAVPLTEYPAVCVLLDRYWSARCSAAVVASHWAVTAAHCITSRLSYVKYNTRQPTSPDGDLSPILYLYKHPKYKVVQEDEGYGDDVTLLHHDIGLVRTRTPMTLIALLPVNPLVAMRRYNPAELKNQEVKVIGFGRTERSSLGEELFAVSLVVVECERASWVHTACGVSAGEGTPGGRGARGVCAGDSGGPVLLRGVQVAVTSMGPAECSHLSPLPAAATSVFTALYDYADLVNDTINDTEFALRMTALRGLAPAPHPRPALVSLTTFLFIGRRLTFLIQLT